MDAQPCPLCAAPADRLPTSHRREFHHCPRCDLVFVPPQWHLSAAAQKRRYLRHRNSIEDPGYVAMLNRPIAMLRRHAHDLRRILDYGCGPTPVLVELLTRAGYDATGHDPIFQPLPKPRQSARTDSKAPTSHATEEHPPPFDAVISVETFEHFAEPRTEIDRILTLLQPHGYLAIMTHFHPGPHGIHDWWYARDPTHVAFYSHKTIDWICDQFYLDLLHRDTTSLALLQRKARSPSGRAATVRER